MAQPIGVIARVRAGDTDGWLVAEMCFESRRRYVAGLLCVVAVLGVFMTLV